MIGGINSPPDAVAATSVLKNLKIPRNKNDTHDWYVHLNPVINHINKFDSSFMYRMLTVIKQEGAYSEKLTDYHMFEFITAIMGITEYSNLDELYNAILSDYNAYLKPNKGIFDIMDNKRFINNIKVLINPSDKLL